MTNDEMQASLQSLFTAAQAQFASSNPGRLAQLASAIGTAEMAADYLFTEIPYDPNGLES